MRRNVPTDSRKLLSTVSVSVLGGEDEAIDLAAEAHDVEPERPLVALGGRGRAGKPSIVISSMLFGSMFSIQPELRYSGERLLGRHAHDVEAQRLRAAVLDAEHRLRGVVEREAVRRREGEAELGMQEAAAAHEAFARVLAVDQAVEAGEILVAVALRRRPARVNWRALATRIVDALRRRRMRRQEVRRARIDAGALRGRRCGVACPSR